MLFVTVTHSISSGRRLIGPLAWVGSSSNLGFVSADNQNIGSLRKSCQKVKKGNVLNVRNDHLQNANFIIQSQIFDTVLTDK